MTGFLKRRVLSRRAFLRGAGAAIALPWLDAMVAGLRAPAEVRRSVFIFAPNGKKMDEWRPTNEGADFELPYLLEPLAAHRDRLLVPTRLDLDAGFAHGDGPGDHARAAASFLTTAHPFKTGGADIRNGISVDQVIAQAVGSATRFPSLELGMERGRRAGVCDSGYSCAYSHNISWSSPSTPVAKETSPKEVFRRLFGDPDAIGDASAARLESSHRRSVLDAVADDARALTRELGATDRAKLDEYLTSVRALERRLAQAELEEPAHVPVPEALANPSRGGGFPERLDLMYELCALALESDATRVISFMLGNAGSNRAYRFLDVPDGHHNLSHHRGDPAKIAKIRKINRWHVERFAAFVDRLAATADGTGSLADHTMVLYGSGLADGNRHRHNDLPVVLVGGPKDLGHGRHLKAKKRTPLGNLYLSLLHRMGVEADSFGDSTGTLLV